MWCGWKTITAGGKNVANKIRFGTDGWRGVIAEEFTFPNLRRVVAGTVSYLKANRPSATGPLLVGYDRRFLSKDFARCVAQCFQSQGLTAKITDAPMTTPSLSVSVVANKSP